MKKTFLCLMIACLSLTCIPNEAKAATESVKKEKGMSEAEAKNLLSRLHQIKVMDKSHLNSTEKKALRKELRSMQEKIRDSGPVIYISAGALLLIIILLILLL
jgi:hypothetical protein